ncbi:MAG: hypothetical protein OEW00_06245 [candidate division Zixibacteria bacterium]|nr:hypothetical protein [candidate division Zixibacteria bacterium]
MKKRFVLHPYLAGLFPILFLFAQNARQMHVTEILLPAAVITVVVFLLTTGLNLALRNTNKSGLIVTIFLVPFFSYGHLLNFARWLGLEFHQFSDRANERVLWTLGGILLVAVFLVVRSRGTLPRLTSLLNTLTVVLVAAQVAVGGYVLASRSAVVVERTEISPGAGAAGPLRDIYYIVVDGYARRDVLKEVFDYDNSDFLAHLRQAGFYVADSSHSNYPQTLLSLSASLNLNYIDQLADFEAGSGDRMPLAKLFQNNAVFQFLRRQGYKIVSFATGYNLTEIKKADYVLSPVLNFTQFQNLVLLTTPLPYWLHKVKSPYDLERDRICFDLEKLRRLTVAPSPFFVFAHILAPHPPFLFDENGEPYAREREFNHADGNHYTIHGGTVEEYISGYRNQIHVVTNLLQQALDEIIANATGPAPIIIVQADHGSGAMLDWNSARTTYLKERLSILNAYYLPGVDSLPLYPAITPVNSFRVVFNEYFGTAFDLLPDRTFYAPWNFPFQYEDVTDKVDLPFERQPEPVTDSATE